MRRNKMGLVAVMAAAIGLVAGWRVSGAPAEIPPAAVSPAATGELERRSSLSRERASRDPFSAGDRSLLAGLYLQRARETGNYEDVMRAEEEARGSLKLRPEQNPASYATLSL